MESLRERLYSLFSKVEVTAWRLLLHTPQVFATTPMIRGVWGRALKHLDNDLYNHVFAGKTTQGQNLPRYIIRPAPPNPETAPALDWILFNVEPCYEQILWRSWDMACGMGLGQKREPFSIRERRFLSPDNVSPRWNAWTLAQATWPLPGDPALTSCVLRAEVPLRLIKRSQLIRFPEFTDLVIASLRRIAGLAGMTRGERYRDLVRDVRCEAKQTIADRWVGEKCSLVRWSAAQQREVELFGVTGSITLSEGVNHLWPLLAVTQWSHIGKGTVYGMGEIRIVPLS